MTAAPDGTIYAVERDEIVHRLPPGGPRWERIDPVLQVPRWRQFDDEVESIAALPGGGFVFTADLGAFRVGDDGGPRGDRAAARLATGVRGRGGGWRPRWWSSSTTATASAWSGSRPAAAR